VLLLGNKGIQLWDPSREIAGATTEDLLALARLHAGETVTPTGVVPSVEPGELERLRRRFFRLVGPPSKEQAVNWWREQLGSLAAPPEQSRLIRLAWLSRLLDLAPEAVDERAERAELLAELRRWKEASADFDRCARERPNDPAHAAKSALCQLADGDQDGFRKRGQALLTTHKGEPGTEVLWMAFAIPGLVTDTRLLTPKALALPNYAHDQLAINGVRVRVGQYDQAIRALQNEPEHEREPWAWQASVSLAGLGAANPLVGLSALRLGWDRNLTLGEPDPARWYLLAIALHHTGKRAEARQAYERARAAKRESRDWEKAVVVRSLRAEVESLLGVPKR
jgi:tetratricopeptide (TPR) repeat protein